MPMRNGYAAVCATATGLGRSLLIDGMRYVKVPVAAAGSSV